mmetsp:Transcript_28/g.72  ORF Transcript_28/g.72 Transcript_28/m.72 type:complete len:204 (+) Transcript_28:2472-3083(+)
MPPGRTMDCDGGDCDISGLLGLHVFAAGPIINFLGDDWQLLISEVSQTSSRAFSEPWDCTRSPLTSRDFSGERLSVPAPDGDCGLSPLSLSRQMSSNGCTSPPSSANTYRGFVLVVGLFWRATRSTIGLFKLRTMGLRALGGAFWVEADRLEFGSHGDNVCCLARYSVVNFLLEEISSKRSCSSSPAGEVYCKSMTMWCCGWG